ncbi:nitrite reductase large subunit NirB [Paenibacillus sp. sptzw28]|uniref:nitrite reductase large subunit NirB n=1 Tax=Paenibacillus sp. sptzw28 TaxID=715179 RepID=UPI001C6E0622|nr:nitrite reductase large subunit NirB [Paenibacillus sp. sptzw28]QYR21386.1 nitrite reductase large subunit NirB [Paenibacillus sp. sptzw28]
MTKQKLVVVGNGMAGVRCVEEILKLAPDAFDITIFGSEPHPNYNRIMLSKVLQGDTTVNDITINDWQWYKDNGILLYSGDPVIEIDTERRRVISENGRNVQYDRLILATGSLPFMLPLPGADLPGVTAFRDINDCNTMMAASKSYKNAVVIGGGLLGLEAARGLLNLGMDVHVVHIFDYLMERQLDPTAARMMRQELEKQGMKFLLEKHTERILGKKRAEGLLFKDGTKVDADLVVIAVGVRPNIKLAADSGVETNRAIVVNDFMETSVSNVYAVGECAEHRGMVYGMVSPLYEQGKVLAKTICEAAGVEPYQGSILASQLKVSGVDVFSAGEIRDSEITTSIKVFDGIKGTYKKVSIRDNKIVGAVLFGDSSEGNKLLGYIKQEADASVLEAQASGGGAADDSYICAMSDKETVCSCNGVSKGAIVEAIRGGGLETFEQVRECTRASSSCGGCKPLVSAILGYTLANAEEAEAPKETICGCSDFSHDELKEAVRSGAFKVEEDAMQQLGWKQAGGCAICRPALRYYIGASAAVAGSGAAAAAVEAAAAGVSGAAAAAGTAEAAALAAAGLAEAASSAAASRLADGTYSIVPRMYGGLTSAQQLRRIADVIDKYGIPHVKLSGSGQLDLLGIPLEAVHAVGSDLAMPLASATYGRPVETVATCAGPGYDRSAVQDSVRLGALLEQRLEGLQMPASIRIGVSGSPLHRAGTLAKDVGIVGAPGGWEIYVGGSGSGAGQLKQAQLLCTEPEEVGTLNMAAAFLQWYREDARFGEATWQWVERIGLIGLREGLFDGLLRQGLLQRMEAQRVVSADGGYGQQLQQQPEAASIR